MTTITELAPGLALVMPQGRERDAIIEDLAEQMAAVILRSGVSLDEEDVLTMLLCDMGYPASWIANLMPPAIQIARTALTIAEALEIRTSDREVWN
ncbi:MAG: hypothetical protein IOC86_00285 [Aestuariivirga sp.]|nr:hypothetical protein [Aestuariivirga sp.]